MPGPLEGYRIIDLCRAGPGRQATGILADYGAEVVSVVQPGYAQRAAPGEGGMRRGDAVNQRNKRSLFLNMRGEGALGVFMRLAEQSDAVLESNRPGAVKRLGVDYDSVKLVKPDIVYCSLTGFGQTGPYSGLAAHDLAFQSVAGMLPLDDDGKPQVPMVSQGQADLNAAYFAAMALLMGLLRRSGSGEGQYIDVSFTDVSLRLPNEHKDEMLIGAYPGLNIYETSDGRHVALSTREPWFWERLCRLLEREDWIPHIRPTGELRDEMFRFFRERFKNKPLAEWMDILEEHDIEFGPVNSSMEHFLNDAHFKAREMILDITAPDTGEKQHEPGFGMKFAGTPAELRHEPSFMGAETDAILTKLGYTLEEQAKLKEDGATG